MKNLLRTVCAMVVAVVAMAAERPNVVLIFADDLGYGDLGCYGATKVRTPHIDRMAKEGMRFTQFHAQTVCGPSRAALMTGCYPLRVAKKANRVEVHPRLHRKEITIAEVLKRQGYATGCFGKWDLAGHSQKNYEQELLPTRQGFDYFFGTPSSNDSIVNLLRNEKVIEQRADMSLLTQRYTDEAIAFIKRSKEQPFFVYLAHTMPHVLLDATEKYRGKSKGGIYGDVVEEIDGNVGRIFKALKEEGLDERTYVIFTSDNGPWFLGRSKGHLKRIGKNAVTHGGTAAPLRGAKTSVWEGGVRVPCVIRAPGRVPAGTECAEIGSTMDFMPTLAALAGTKAPDDRVIDGHDIRDLVHGVEGAKSPTEFLYHYAKTRLGAVRSGKWKLNLPRPVDQRWQHYSKAKDAIAIPKPMLIDLDADPAETTDVAAQHPEVVARLMAAAERARADIGDHDRVGKNARFFDPQPRRPDVKKK